MISVLNVYVRVAVIQVAELWVTHVRHKGNWCVRGVGRESGEREEREGMRTVGWLRGVGGREGEGKGLRVGVRGLGGRGSGGYEDPCLRMGGGGEYCCLRGKGGSRMGRGGI